MKMSTFIKKYPALSLFVLALILGTAPSLAVAAGLLPAGAVQLSALSAGMAGIILAAIEGRKGGVRELLGRFLIWRVGIQWWAYGLFFMILPAVAALYLVQLFGGPSVNWSGLDPLYSVIPSIIFLIIFAGIGEEFGWRGFAMPRLQARHNALISSLIVGVLWSLWHLPLYFIKGTSQNDWVMAGGFFPTFFTYSAFVIAWSIQMGWVFNNTKGSVLLAAVVHGAGNAWLGSIDVFSRGGFIGLVIFTAVNVIVSICIVLITGPALLSRTNHRNVLEPETG
jgi:membrane protease YdiL (CAAX protease family)